MAGLNKQEEIIKKYLDEESKKDGALKAVYKPEAIHKCFAFIRDKAHKEAVNGCAMIEDTKVYKWARDYYYDVLPGKNESAEQTEEQTGYNEEEIDEMAEEMKTAAKSKKKESKKEELEFVGSLF